MSYIFKTNCSNCGLVISRPEREDGLPDMVVLSLVNENFYLCKKCYEVVKNNLYKTIFKE